MPRGAEPDLPLVPADVLRQEPRLGRQGDGGSLAGQLRLAAHHQKIKVPKAAREGMLQVGLLGATGEISFDDFQLKVVK